MKTLPVDECPVPLPSREQDRAQSPDAPFLAMLASVQALPASTPSAPSAPSGQDPAQAAPPQSLNLVSLGTVSEGVSREGAEPAPSQSPDVITNNTGATVEMPASIATPPLPLPEGAPPTADKASISPKMPAIPKDQASDTPVALVAAWPLPPVPAEDEVASLPTVPVPSATAPIQKGPSVEPEPSSQTMPASDMNEGGPPTREARSASPLVHPHVVLGQSPTTTSDPLPVNKPQQAFAKLSGPPVPVDDKQTEGPATSPQRGPEASLKPTGTPLAMAAELRTNAPVVTLDGPPTPSVDMARIALPGVQMHFPSREPDRAQIYMRELMAIPKPPMERPPLVADLKLQAKREVPKSASNPSEESAPDNKRDQLAPAASPVQERIPEKPIAALAPTPGDIMPVPAKPTASEPVPCPIGTPQVSHAPSRSIVTTPTEGTPMPRPTATWNQVEGSVRWMLQHREQSAELQLHPESLGHVLVKLKVENGEVHMRLWASDASTVQALQEDKGRLDACLREHGLNLGSFDLQQGHRGQETPREILPFTPMIEAKPDRKPQQEMPEAPVVIPRNAHRIELIA